MQTCLNNNLRLLSVLLEVVSWCLWSPVTSMFKSGVFIMISEYEV